MTVYGPCSSAADASVIHIMSSCTSCAQTYLSFLTLPYITYGIYLFIYYENRTQSTDKKIKTKGAGSLNKLPTAEACTW